MLKPGRGDTKVSCLTFTRKRVMLDLDWQEKINKKEVGSRVKILYGLIAVMVVFVVLAYAIPAIWPLISESTGNITAMEGTDAGTNLIKSFWPVAIILAGLAIAIGFIIFIVKKFSFKG